MFEKFTEKAKRILFLARYEASQQGSKVIATEHLLSGLLKEGEETIRELFARANVSMEMLQAELGQDDPVQEKLSTSVEIPFSDETKIVLRNAESEAERLMHPYIGTEHILLGLLRLEDSTAGRMLIERGMHIEAVREDAVKIYKRRALPKKKKETPFLNEFSRDLSELAERRVFDPLIGRESELERVVQVLSRRRKNNPVLLGEPGVGKTAIVEGLATRIIDGEVPPSLLSKRILALDLSLVVAGTKYRGQFEERLKGIISELTNSDDVMVFIDEIHSLIGAGSAEGSLDAANILKPTLSRGEVQCIGATTPRDYHKHIEKDRALVRRFQPITIKPPSEAETIAILEGVKERYERFHGVSYTDEALRAAVYQANRYITDRFLPDKAIDVLDEAGARVKLGKSSSYAEIKRVERELRKAVDGMKSALARKDFDEAVAYHDEEVTLRRRHEELKDLYESECNKILDVDRADVEEVIARWTGIPIQAVAEEEAEKLMNIEAFLHRRIVGQDAAISALARAIRRSRAGLSSPDRPIGSFVFLGPTGVGKTEVARTLAEFLFSSERSLVRFDMSEYMEKHAIAKMIGSPPGYIGHEEGGQLTERIKRKPYSVILLDEIEKAHPDVLNILLQVLEDGTITDAYGQAVDFKNTIVIMTSNIGSGHVDQTISKVGFKSDDRVQEFKERRDMVLAEVKRTLSPEFINRIDEVIVFDSLTEEQLGEIARIMIRRLNASLSDRNTEIVATDEACRWLVQATCKDRAYGARPLRRAIQKHIEDALSDAIITGRFQGQGVIEVYLDGEKLNFRDPVEVPSL
ncbi:MAG: ATP-dependent Clp protease ATP-binding subunit [Acidobacteria bacterium]|uniref:ATP-dependent Clp protease ATP-binding subunit n=1 Tax=Candidatus Polarisedimenticola svalbardensis TaxID=2886004 RepID=A0A8J6XSQ1_9BACT|nr:ATP-dependent Clp protease ATP-binding subunit [Candidatus Polarisedimenticola svalbardensis]